MSSLISKIKFIVAFVFFIFMIHSSMGSSLENDKLAQLIERLDIMQTKIDAIRSREEMLEAENAQLTERLNVMQTKMDAIQSRMEVENDKWTRRFGDLEAENEKLKRQISHTKFSLMAPRDGGQPTRGLTNPPTSCQELKNQNGLWPMDGIHLLKMENTIKAAFCTFAADGSPVTEVLIGQVNVETKPVHFYVQRRSGFSKTNSVIPFDVALLNEGDAFDLSTGIFKIPVSGIYHFDVSALKAGNVDGCWIDLQVNRTNIGRAGTYHSSKGNFDGISMSTSLRLAAGDTVNLFNSYSGSLFEDSTSNMLGHYTHFAGWLVKEALI